MKREKQITVISKARSVIGTCQYIVRSIENVQNSVSFLIISGAML